MNFSKHSDKFSLKVNKTPLGQVTYYKVEKIPTEEADAPTFHIEICRRVANNPDRELVNFYTLGTYNITFVRAGKRITFISCETTRITEQIGEDRLIYETINLSAQARAVTDPDDPDNPFEELE